MENNITGSRLVAPSTLYLVATPIGNLKDISYRALEVLESVDLIAAEDTRNTVKLLNHYNINTPLSSYHEHNKIKRSKELIEKLKGGSSIALVSDAGMPAISDPGEDMVAAAHEEGISVSVVPGACAFVSALAISGLSSRRFVFEGFLPFDKKERRQVLEDLAKEKRTVVFYEAPHKLIKTLKDIAEFIEEDRKISIVRELSKMHEEVFNTTIKEAIRLYDEGIKLIKGEYVIVINAKDEESIKKEEEKKWDELSLEEHMKIYEDKGLDRKAAMKSVAMDRNVSKREIYNKLLRG